MKRLNVLFFLILPLLLMFTAIFLNDNRGPYWMGNNLDPEYVYLLNASNLAHMKGVGHIDHPGTPVQVLGAVTIRTMHLFRDTGNDLKKDVIQNPEYYLKGINAVMTTVNCLILLILGIAALKTTGKIWLGILLQASPFFSITLLQFGLTRMTPEPMLFTASSLMVLLILIFSSNKTDTKTGNITGGQNHTEQACRSCTPNRANTADISDWKTIALFAMVAGFGIAVKITFIPLLAIPFLAIRGIKKKMLYGSAAVMGFIVFTLPIIRMYPRFFGWIYNLGTHSGQYGSGASKMVSSSVLTANIKKLLWANPFFSVTLMVVLVTMMVLLLLKSTRRKSFKNIHFKFLAGTAAAQVAGLLMVSKHSANHYLLPVLNLSGITLVLLYLLLKNILTEENTWVDGHKEKIVPGVFVLYIAIMLTAINPVGKIMKLGTGLKALKNKCTELHERVEQEYKGYAKISFYRSSSPQYALKFGNDISRSHHSDILDDTYKDAYFYDIWNKTFSRFRFGKRVPFKEIREKYGDKIVFQGTPVEMKGLRKAVSKEISEKVILKKVHQAGRMEAVYIIKNRIKDESTDNQT